MQRLREPNRVPSAEPIGIGYVTGHRLTFDKISSDGTGKCDCEAINDAGVRVYGVLYEIPSAEKSALDIAEGLGKGYKEKVIHVFPAGDLSGARADQPLEAVTYYATRKDSALKPFTWYKELVLEGAREHGLPPEYVSEFIEPVETVSGQAH